MAGGFWIAGPLSLGAMLAAATGYVLGMSGRRLRRAAFLAPLHALAVFVLLQAALGLRSGIRSLDRGHHAVLVAIVAGCFLIAALRLSGKEKPAERGGSRVAWTMLVRWLYAPFLPAFVYLVASIIPQESKTGSLCALVVTVDVLACTAGLTLASRFSHARVELPSPALARFMLWVAVLLLNFAFLVPGISGTEEKIFRPLLMPSFAAMAALASTAGLLGSLGVFLGMRRRLMW